MFLVDICFWLPWVVLPLYCIVLKFHCSRLPGTGLKVPVVGGGVGWVQTTGCFFTPVKSNTVKFQFIFLYFLKKITFSFDHFQHSKPVRGGPTDLPVQLLVHGMAEVPYHQL